MKLVGTFTEEQCRRKEDKAECERVERESNGVLKYFTTKFRRRKGKDCLEVYAMSLDEYLKHPGF